VSLKIWDTATGLLERECQGGHSFVALSPDDQWLVSAGPDSSILIWDTQTWTIRHRIEYDGKSLSTSPRVSRNFLLLASKDRKLELWSLETGQVYKALAIPEEADEEIMFSNRGVYSAAISHDESWIACVYGSRVVLVWDTETGEVVGDFAVPNGILNDSSDGVRFSSDDSAIGVNDDGDLMEFAEVQDAATGKSRWVFSHRLDWEQSTPGWRKWEPKGPYIDLGLRTSQENDFWITLNDENLIWVPPEFAETRCATLIGRNIVALGLLNGGVYCITFNAEFRLNKLSL
jgi:WD40 repeat protein